MHTHEHTLKQEDIKGTAYMKFWNFTMYECVSSLTPCFSG